ncbi:MAG: hypothetical protein R3B47_14795 [Bacteroidia bacterium]
MANKTMKLSTPASTAKPKQFVTPQEVQVKGVLLHATPDSHVESAFASMG